MSASINSGESGRIESRDYEDMAAAFAGAGYEVLDATAERILLDAATMPLSLDDAGVVKREGWTFAGYVGDDRAADGIAGVYSPAEVER